MFKVAFFFGWVMRGGVVKRKDDLKRKDDPSGARHPSHVPSGAVRMANALSGLQQAISTPLTAQMMVAPALPPNPPPLTPPRSARRKWPSLWGTSQECSSSVTPSLFCREPRCSRSARTCTTMAQNEPSAVRQARVLPSPASLEA